MQALIQSPAIPALVLALQNWQSAVERICFYLTYQPIPNVKASVVSLVEGVLILAVAMFLSRTLSKMLQNRIAKRAYLDPGLRYTMGRLTQYIVIAVGLLLALSTALDLNFTSLAVVFTALSVGIGFGLQYIAADIASGFILLFERPVRVGDRITIGKEEGDVQSINLRTTVMTTNDRVSVIVSNSQLVREHLINWSYGVPRSRIAIPIGVSAESDIDLVSQTLLKAAEEVDNVLTDPAPKVQFLKFGDWSLDFRLLVWTNTPRLHMQIRSDINYRIDKLFRDANIGIPYPQTELRIRQGSLHIDTDDTLHLHDDAQSDVPADS